MQLPGSPDAWYNELAKIARQEVFKLSRKGLWFPTVREAVCDAIAEAWKAITAAAHEIANVWGYARVIMRYRLINAYHATARRFAPSAKLEPRTDAEHDELFITRGERGFERDGLRRMWHGRNDDGRRQRQRGNEGYYDPPITIDPWPDIEFRIAGSQLVEKHARSTAPYDVTPKKEARSRQADQQARARFEQWYQNSKRRRYD